MERQSKGSRGLEAYCKRGQGPRRAVAPSKKKKYLIQEKMDCKAFSLQAWTGPEDSMKLRLPDFVTTAQDGS